MDRIEKYKRVEEDRQQEKSKDKATTQDRKDFRSDRYNNSKPRRDFAGHSGSANVQTVNTVFKDPVHQVLDKVKNEPFFRWPNKMVGNPDRRNHNVYSPGRTGSRPSKVMSVARLPVGDVDKNLKSPGHAVPLVLGFSDEDKAGTIQPHEDALVVTLRIGGYDVKRVMVDQGSAVEIMYPDLFRGLNLAPSDLTPYCSSLFSFEGRMVMPKGKYDCQCKRAQKSLRWISSWWMFTPLIRQLWPGPGYTR
ncbi:uncharacterized protein LOC136067450 [Quercus suber]|uniref:uncharacterized protein LOC136067450 n=1 Tax=Quercus suber TaxID=58331 RepID=UPI0032DE9172